MSSEEYIERIKLYIGLTNYKLLESNQNFLQLRTNDYFDIQHSIRLFLKSLPKIKVRYPISRRSLLNRPTHRLLDDETIYKINLLTNKLAFNFLKKDKIFKIELKK
jgi:hypothetical protein